MINMFLFRSNEDVIRVSYITDVRLVSEFYTLLVNKYAFGSKTFFVDPSPKIKEQLFLRP